MTELGSTCSHGARWDEECRECDLVLARQFVEHWGSKVDEARKVIAAADNEASQGGSNFTLKVGGKPFLCQCGCNVFRRMPDKIEYRCNACELLYEAQ